MNILFFGSSSSLSTRPLVALLQSNKTICAIAYDCHSNIDNTLPNISVINNATDSIEAIAFDYNIPLIRLADNFTTHIEDLNNYHADLIIVSCYGRKIPDAILSIPRLGAFNLHPSLLPDYRGPEPLFWQLKKAERHMGISMHRMTPFFDQGNIINQTQINLHDGMSLSQIKIHVAESIAELLIKTLDNLASYIKNESQQNTPTIPYQSFPEAIDFNVSTHWSAQHMFNFMSAYTLPGQYFICIINDVEFHLSSALAYDSQKRVAEDYLIEAEHITINCSDGLIRCQLAHYPL